MQRVTLGKFLEKTTTYERMSVRIDPGLRRGIWLSELLMSGCMLIYYILPHGNYMRNSLIFLWVNKWLASAWDFTADHRQLLLMLCALIFFITLSLAIPTGFYQSGEINLHIALFFSVIFAMLNLVFVIVLLFPLITNLLIWFFFLVLCFVTGTLFMTSLFRILAH